VGGNTGQALAPLITALVLVPLGQFGAIWFTLVAGLAVIFLLYIAKWYGNQMTAYTNERKKEAGTSSRSVPKKAIVFTLLILIFMVFARSWYQNAISNFYAFYAIDKYSLSIAEAQIYIFLFLLMGAIGTFIGGPLAERFGERYVILFYLLARAPLTILLLCVGQHVAMGMLCIIGLLLLSSFSVIVVYAQELVPGKIGTMSGLIVGLAFGMGAIGSVVLGALIDWIGLLPTMIFVSLLPL